MGTADIKKNAPITFSEIAVALASDYESIYVINSVDDSYVEYLAEGNDKELTIRNSGDNFYKDVPKNARKLVHPEDQDYFIHTFKKDAVMDGLKNAGSFSLDYRLVIDGKPVHYFLKTIRGFDDRVIIGVQNVEEQWQREREAEREIRTYRQIAMALSTRYEVIYHVNIRTNAYREYSSSYKYARLQLGATGKDFFAETQENMKEEIYPEDLPMMQVAMEKDFLLRSLADDGKMSLSYRLMLEGRPQFVTLFAVRPREDSEHIIVAIANVDAAKRKEMEYERAIGSAIDIANKDALTGVKNKYAYATAEMGLDEKIQKDEIHSFAVVICDINGLKQVNDTRGHSAGDYHIQSACRIICKVFSHSPVFRIGGDEFVVLLTGGDFDRRGELIERLAMVQEENRKSGAVTFAYGISDYDPETDIRVKDVFERADSQMYERKKRIKEGIFDDEDQKKIPEERKIKLAGQDALRTYPKERKDRLDGLFQSFSIVAEGTYVYLCDMRYDISRWSKNAVLAFGLPSEYMHAAGDIWENRIHPEDAEVYRMEIDNIFSGRAVGHDMQYRAQKADGEYVICTCRGNVLIDEHGIPEYFVGSIRNQSVQDHIDSLTGLSNQYGFLEMLQGYMVREQEMEITLLGIGRFAEFNEVYGYHFGNRILQSFARYLYEYVGNTGHVFRMDGTKFIVISNTYGPAKIRERYEDLRAYCRTSFQVDGRSIILDLNAGHISVKTFDVDSQTVYACLSFVYSESKLHKQGDMVSFLNHLSNENSQRIEKLHYIRSSIIQNYKGFYLVYQPVVDSKTEQLIGAEALIRWRSERYGVVPPDHFIPLLEKDPLFPELGKWILQTALRDAKRIMERVPDFTVNVNLSYTQLEKGGFVDMVLQTLKDADFPPDHLCLEITERCRLLDMKILKDMITALRSYGVRFALDDFGTGFSSIGLVKNLPFDTIKIDRSFVMKIEEDEKEKALVENFVNMAATFGAKVCIEGIETAGMKEILRKYKVQSFQGYYYGKPLPIVEIENILNDWNARFDVKDSSSLRSSGS